MPSFRSPWMDWQGSETLPCSTDNTAKSPSVSFDSSTSRGFRQKSERVHCIVLRGVPHFDGPDAADPVDGRRIIQAIERHGGSLTIERHGIALRWTGHLPNTGAIIDRIRINRIGVVVALEKALDSRRRT